MICSLSDSIEDIVDAVRHANAIRERIRVEPIPFTLACLPYTKPYCLIQRNEGDKLNNRSEEYFYEVLFSAVSRVLLDAGLKGEEIKDMDVFFGSTSMMKEGLPSPRREVLIRFYTANGFKSCSCTRDDNQL